MTITAATNRQRRFASRLRSERRRTSRRKWDFYRELGKFAGLVASVCAAMVGQAELIGEPWRHYVTVIAISFTAIWAYCMRPTNVWKTLARYRAKP